MGIAPALGANVMARRFACLLVCLPVMVLTAQGASAATQVLIFTGLAGEEAYATGFAEQAEGFAAALRNTGAQVAVFNDSLSSAENIRRQLANAHSLGSADQLVLIYVGHGSYDGRRFKINLRGPDVSAAELDQWLDQVPARQLVILASSASGAAIEVLADPRRTLMTATRSGDQSNVTVFGSYLLAALDDASADLDKDRALSVQEVFQLTTRAVEEHYQRRRLIATEHPQLNNVQAGFVLSHVSTQPGNTIPIGLASRRADAEAAIEGLKARKADMSPDVYFQQLQQLLLDLAVIEQEIERAQVAAGAEGS